MVITVGYIPIVLPALLPGTSVNPAQIARSLVLLMLLPLGGALAVNAYRPQLAVVVKPPLDQIANVSLIALIALQTLLNLRSVADVFGTFGILAAVVFLAAGYATGWVLGGPASDTRVVLGLGTSQRNIAASLVVASQNFDDPTVVVMVVVVAVASSLVLIPLARMLAPRAT
jgi:BASS family bile acid:Na+ symporter